MEYVLTLSIGERGVKLFTGGDLAPVPHLAAPLHLHPYPEVHILFSGEADYTVAGVHHSLTAGDALLIPANTLHETTASPDCSFTAFQLDLAAEEVLCVPMPPALLALFRKEGTAAALPALFYLIAHLAPAPLYRREVNGDHAYLIHEFLETNYSRPIRLADLAEVLHLSERQTQRILREMTGQSFCELLCRQRMKVADRLRTTTDMPLTAIAEYVGYASYSGFRKAVLRGEK